MRASRRFSTRPLPALIACFGAGVLAVCAGNVRAWAAPPAAVPPDHQAAIFARVLAFDRSLKARVGKTITIGILYLASDDDSKQARQRMTKAFDALERDIQDLPSRLASHAYHGPKDLAEWIDDNEVDVIYLTAGFEPMLSDVRTVVTQKKVVTLSPVRAYVEQGLAVAVVAQGNRPQLVVNLPATRAAGMDLDPKVLQLSDVIK
jgi:hypothetical protein